MGIVVENMWIVQYLREAPPYSAEYPRVYRVVTFAGDTVWGLNVSNDVLAKVNRGALDNSGRVVNMKAYASEEAALNAAVELGAELAAQVATTQTANTAAARAKRLEQEAKYPALLTEEQEKEQERGQVTVQFTTKQVRS
jgi:hypothetical protein